MLHIAGVYYYHRFGHDERELELRWDGTIGRGCGGAERTWQVRVVQGARRLSLFGDHGETCRLNWNGDGTWSGNWRKFERMPIELVRQRRCDADPEIPPEYPCRNPGRGSEFKSAALPKPGVSGTLAADSVQQSAVGQYLYRRVHHDDRLMELLPDGAIGQGAAGCEQRWSRNGSRLEISGSDGVICSLKQDGDGIWRGNWTQHGRMPIELYPRDVQAPPMPSGLVSYKFPEGPGFWWSNYESLGRAVRKLCRQLPPLRAVAGIPRSGIIPASLIAQWQNIPLLDIDEALVSSPHIPSYRRRGAKEIDHSLPILILDDTVCSGRVMSWYRSRAKGKGNYLFAAMYVDRDHRHLVDLFAEDHPRCNQAFEWNLLHEATNSERALCDLDGVICEEWTGGDEEQNPQAYRRHLAYAKPLRVPTKPILGVVTGRMQIYREQTEAWLRRHGVQYYQLWMLPAATERERSQIGPAQFKASIFAKSCAALFVESCPDQSRRIHELTGKPVIDFTNMIAHGATIVR